MFFCFVGVHLLNRFTLLRSGTQQACGEIIKHKASKMLKHKATQ